MIAQLSLQHHFYGWNKIDETTTFATADKRVGATSVTDPITVTIEGVKRYIGREAVKIADTRAIAYVTV